MHVLAVLLGAATPFPAVRAGAAGEAALLKEQFPAHTNNFPQISCEFSQMKKKYSTARPYGQWLQEEVVSLEQIVASVPEKLRVAPPINEAHPAAAAHAANANG